MADNLTKEQRHKNMQHIRSRDTKPEILLRKKLWSMGLRYRKNYKDLPGTPDLYMPRYKICIFIDSEYFHGRDWECTDNGYSSHKYGSLKEQVKNGNHPEFWTKKIENNIAHDNSIDNELRGKGFIVIRFWSKDILKNIDECIKTIQEIAMEYQIQFGTR